MIGAIAGDIIGSVYEGLGEKTKRFPLFGPHNWFTDDTVLTVAVAESILRGSDLVDILHDYFHRYPQVGYGGSFIDWAVLRRREPYNSWGNGSAMRVSPVEFAYDTDREPTQNDFSEIVAEDAHKQARCSPRCSTCDKNAKRVRGGV
jgi:ADP-ribosylglycohydrolase